MATASIEKTSKSPESGSKIVVYFSGTLTLDPAQSPAPGAGAKAFEKMILDQIKHPGFAVDNIHTVSASIAKQAGPNNLLTYDHEVMTPDGKPLTRTYSITEPPAGANRQSQVELRFGEVDAPILVAVLKSRTLAELIGELWQQNVISFSLEG